MKNLNREELIKEFRSEYKGQSPHWSIKKYKTYTKDLSKEEELVFRCHLAKEINKEHLRSWDMQFFEDLGLNKYGEPLPFFKIDLKGLALLRNLTELYFGKIAPDFYQYLTTGTDRPTQKFKFVNMEHGDMKLFYYDLMDALEYLEDFDKVNHIHTSIIAERLFNLIDHNWKLETIKQNITRVRPKRKM